MQLSSASSADLHHFIRYSFDPSYCKALALQRLRGQEKNLPIILYTELMHSLNNPIFI